MKVSEIIEIIEKLAPPWAQADWDRSGIQAAAERVETDKVAVCLDPLPERIKAAIDRGAGFILAHHPLALKAELPNRRNAYWQALRLLFGGDVWLYSAHTSLDVNIGGPAGWLAKALDLHDWRILEECARPDANFPAGLGFGAAGTLPQPVSSEALLEKIVRLTGGGHAALCGPKLPRLVRRLAFCGGSGASMAEAALKAGAELFVTGDVKYHAALEAPLPILDVGHFSYENEMMRQMASLLQQGLDGVEVIFVDGSDPFRLVESLA